jgi:hypothetical protein|tara:strand:+ start:187 stop:369 length:183 start_codon:yes stop_codon:yes gene_type:complete
MVELEELGDMLQDQMVLLHPYQEQVLQQSLLLVEAAEMVLVEVVQVQQVMVVQEVVLKVL